MQTETEETRTDSTRRTRFGATFLALFGLGFIGVLSLIPTIIAQLGALPPELADLPVPLALLVSLINPLILLAIAVAAGTLLAHRVGLRSLVAEKVREGASIWPRLRPHVPRAFVMGALFMVVVVVADAVVNPFADAEQLTEPAAAASTFGQVLSALVLGLFYGGITEELLLRWGLMSLLVWIGWWAIQRRQGAPKPALVWTAVVVSALLFGAGHLPALAAMVSLTPLLIIRTVALNALGGVLFGWLFWRHSLEVAMVAHASAHVALFVINLIGLLIAGS